VGLLTVPWAASGRAKARHESDEFFEGWAGGGGALAFGFFGGAFAGRHEEKKDYHTGSRGAAEGAEGRRGGTVTQRPQRADHRGHREVSRKGLAIVDEV